MAVKGSNDNGLKDGDSVSVIKDLAGTAAAARLPKSRRLD